MAAMTERLRSVKLPAMPGTMTRLMAAFARDDHGVIEIEKILRTDEATAAAVLRVANSAAQGAGSDRVFDLQESITRIGGSAVERICMSSCSQALLFAAGRGYGLDRGELWRGSLCGALGAEMLANSIGFPDPTLCFIAGLLRDVGKLALEAMCGAKQLEAGFATEHPNEEQLELERRLFDCDHAQLGYELGQLWNLPDRLTNSIRRHHEPSADADDQDTLYDIVHCADVLCCWLAVGVGLDGLAYALDERAAAVLGLNPSTIGSHLADLRQRFDRVSQELTESKGAE